MILLKILRAHRKRLWRWQIILGDVIALLNGTYLKRMVRKKANKIAGRAANLRGW